MVYEMAGQLVGFDEGVGRAGHRAVVAHRSNQGPRKRRLAGAELSLEQDGPARRVNRQNLE